MIKKLFHFFSLSLTLICISTSGAFSAPTNATNACLRTLATELVDIIDKNVDTTNDVVIIASDGLIEFFTKNIKICKDYLLKRVSPDEDILVDEPDLYIDVEWDYILEEVAAALSATGDSRTLYVCENDRSYQAGLDGLLWAATIIAAIFSGGSGGVAIQGVKEGIKQGGKFAIVTAAKGLAKIGVKKGAQTLLKQAGKIGTKQAAKATAVTAANTAYRASIKAATKNSLVSTTKAELLRNGKKSVRAATIKKAIETKLANKQITAASAKEAIKLLDDQIAKRAALNAAKNTATNAVVKQAVATGTLQKLMQKYPITKTLAAAGGIATVYSWLESDLDPTVMNCTDTDQGTGCYTSCTKDGLSSPTDDLNTKVFRPIFGKNLCVDDGNGSYVLREITGGAFAQPGDIFVAPDKKWEQAKTLIKQSVADQGSCDWSSDDIDMYIAAPIYDPTTLAPSETGLIIDAIRLDD